MRLDLFLKTSRLIMRRTLAQQFCDKGLVSVNGAKAKSSREIKTGDEIEIKRANHITKVRVLELPKTKQVSKDSASMLYEILSEVSVEDSLLDSAPIFEESSVNPTK